MTEEATVIATLKEHGPLTAAQLADLIYPKGNEFHENWDLSAEEKVDMTLRSCGNSVEVVGQVFDEDDTPYDLWQASTDERRAELRAAQRRERAAYLLSQRRRERSGEMEPFELRLWNDAKERRRETRRRLRLTPAEQVAEWNADLRSRSAALQAKMEELFAEITTLHGSEESHDAVR